MGEDKHNRVNSAFSSISGAGGGVDDARTPDHDHAPTMAAEPKTLSQKFADAVTRTIGSAKFIVAQTATLGLWLGANVAAFTHHWDPYPFILLNLVLSFQAAYTGPFVLMSQNREAETDRKAAENDYKVNLKAECRVEGLHRKVDSLLSILAPVITTLTPEQRAKLGITEAQLRQILDTHETSQPSGAIDTCANTASSEPPKKLSLSQRFADAVTDKIGSLKFVAFQTAALGLWLGANVTALVKHWDPYPFILLNLALSFQAAYTGPFVLMSQNRQAESDRKAAENDHEVNRNAERRIEELNGKIDTLVSLFGPVMAILTPEQRAALGYPAAPRPVSGVHVSETGDDVIIPDAHLLPPSAGHAQNPAP